MPKYKRYPPVLLTLGDIERCPGVVRVEERGVYHIEIWVKKGRYIQPIVDRLPVPTLAEFIVFAL
jgi:hypothetical protein